MKVVESKLIKFLEDAPLFFQPWWLETVSPGAWDYVIAKRGDEIAAVLPYTFKMRLNRFRLIEMPPFTPHLGPWLRPSTAKYANRLGEEKDLMSELIDGLPAFAVFDQSFHPAITNWLPFYWKGFSESTRYTYRIEDSGDLDRLWAETLDNVRTDLKKAQKQLTVSEADNVEQLVTLHEMTFLRQNSVYPYSVDMIRRLDRECAVRGARKILLAADATGTFHAGIYLLKDQKNVYYLMGGANPDLRKSGASSLLVWKGIEWASAAGLSFDFEGSIVEPIERFFRAFGAVQTPYFTIKKEASALVMTYRKLRSLF